MYYNEVAIKFKHYNVHVTESRVAQLKYIMCMLLTLNRVAQLSTHHSSISTSPGVITYSTPHIVDADLKSTFIFNVTSCQSQLTIHTRS